ncbi:uncharacterized protein Tco025E_02751 [Trypanosoma conorhini]|uniref:Leucine-rich repeat protein (LRRP) n=1 Tax=Trypanosoma conorhini TaxID=83891 RepID=A0A422Q0X3_9TRYP|nr:uncharacterized protein Tco025E_02751 [Trypanosoma conorhini]RNF23651.1 hypothetical protein Tco025E_02751 [Trypanosoma conorhini]
MPDMKDQAPRGSQQGSKAVAPARDPVVQSRPQGRQTAVTNEGGRNKRCEEQEGPVPTGPVVQSRPQGRQTPVTNEGVRNKRCEEQEGPVPTGPVVQSRPQGRQTPVTKEAFGGGVRDGVDAREAADRDPLTTTCAPELTPTPIAATCSATETAKRRVADLRKACPFLSLEPSLGIFLEDLNLADPRLDAAMNRMRAVRGNASVMRDYRSIALVEDSVSAVVESVAAELSRATSRMLLRYPFLDGRVRGVLLGNIHSLDTDEDIQSLLMIRRDAERARRPTESIDTCLRERAAALVADIPYVVEEERCRQHPFVLTAPPASFASSRLPCEAAVYGDRGGSQLTKQAEVLAPTPPEPPAAKVSDAPPQTGAASRDATAVQAAAGGGATTPPRAPTAVPAAAEAKAPSPSDSPSEKTLPHASWLAKETAGAGAAARSPVVGKINEEEYNLPTTRLPPTNLPSLAGKPCRANEPMPPAASKPSAFPAVQEARDNAATTVPSPGMPRLPSPAGEKQGVTEVARKSPCPVAAPNNVGLAAAPSAESQPAPPEDLNFLAVHRELEHERQKLEMLEAILGEVRHAGMGLLGGESPPTGEDVSQTPPEEVRKLTLTEGVQQAVMKSSHTGLLPKTPSPFLMASNPPAEGGGWLCPSATQPAAARRNSASLGLSFEQRQPGQTTRGQGSNGGNELLVKLLEERRRQAGAKPARERGAAEPRPGEAKHSSANSLPMCYKSLSDAVVRSSWGDLRSDTASDWPGVLPSLARVLSQDGGSKQQPSYDYKRRPWGRYTLRRDAPAGATVQRRLSSAPGNSRRDDESHMLFPAISSCSSSGHFQRLEEDAEWEKVSNANMGLSQKYAWLCRQAGIKPNSVLLRALPEERGASVSRIDSSVNYIGPRGIMPLLKVLQSNVGLEYLNLSRNNLENDEVIELVKLLMTESGAALQFLDLSNNPISLAGGAALLRLVQARPALHSVRLRGTLVPQQVSRSIQEVCDSNHSGAS